MDLDLSDKPDAAKFRYLEIVDALGRKIREGGLLPGTRLPTQRTVANQLGISIATVNRAYVEAARRGLVVAHVGRGTFVAGEPEDEPGGAKGQKNAAIDLTTNRLTLGFGAAAHLKNAMQVVYSGQNRADVLLPQPGPGHRRHRIAGCKWLKWMGIDADPDEVAICHGLQHGLSLILAAFAKPGDTILTEELNYPGIKLLDKVHDVRIKGLPMDDEGLIPEGVEEACAARRARFLVCTPSLHNPTNAVMPAKRRKALARIAERHDLLIIECDNNEIPLASPPPSLCGLAGDRGFHISSAWRVSGSGIHLGFIRAPAAHAARVALALQATTWMVSPLFGEIFSIWIDDGTAARTLEWHREENARRLGLARKILDARAIGAHPDSANVWLRLPAPWRHEDFAQLAAVRGVLVTTADVFAVGRTVAPHAIRISLGGERELASLERGLRILAELLAAGPHPAKLLV